jgi:hypothetical protein
MALFRKKTAKTPAPAAPDLATIAPVVSLIVADIALRAGGIVLRRSVEMGLLNGKAVPGRVIRGRTLKETVIGTVLAAVARRSVPGAILVGGGLLAKMMSDQKRANRQKPE